MIRRIGITDAQWKKLKPYLPKPAKTGRPPKCDRQVIDGICWVLRTGSPWADLPAKYGKYKTVFGRYRKWTLQGLWKKILKILRKEAQKRGEIDWTINHIDGTVVRAHKHAAGAHKRDVHDDKNNKELLALGRSVGGFSTKVMLRVEGNGKPMQILLAPGQRHDSKLFFDAMKGGKVGLNGRGRPKQKPNAVAMDKAFSSKEIRNHLKTNGIGRLIPWKSNQRRRGPFDVERYKERNIVERTIGRLKEYRRLATRYDKLPEQYLGMWELASIFMWL